MGQTPAKTTALTIGNFDGVHVGHQQLIQTAREAAGPSGRVVAVTFDPHPRQVLRPDRPGTVLSTIGQRRTWLKEAGADEVDVIETTGDLLAQTADEFLSAVFDRYFPAAIVEGKDFRFGCNRHGDIELLRTLAAERSCRVTVIDDVEMSLGDQQIVPVGSSMIKELIRLGRVADASLLLGRPYTISGQVRKGDQLGRTLGVPTANLVVGSFVMPADGVYAGTATASDHKQYLAAISVGTKPTFGGDRRFCEAHLLDYAGPLDHYDWTIELELNRWLRDQMTFEDVDLLVEQMQRDIDRVRNERAAHPRAVGVLA